MEVLYQYYKQRNSNVIAPFLDYFKAFDKFDILICKGMMKLLFDCELFGEEFNLIFNSSKMNSFN